jgi:hypothetical protein
VTYEQHINRIVHYQRKLALAIDEARKDGFAVEVTLLDDNVGVFIGKKGSVPSE